MFSCTRCSWCDRVWRLKLRWWDDRPATSCRSSRTSRTSRRVVPSFQKAILSTAGSPLPPQLNNLSPLTVDTSEGNINKTCNINKVLSCWLNLKDDTNFLLKLISNNSKDSKTCFAWSRSNSLYNSVWVSPEWPLWVEPHWVVGGKLPDAGKLEGNFPASPAHLIQNRVIYT